MTRSGARSRPPGGAGPAQEAPPPDLPSRTHLPSGLVVSISAIVARRRAAVLRVAAPTAHALAILRGEGVLASSEGHPISVDDLDLVDFHVLVAMLARSGLIEEGPQRRTCENCDAPLVVSASAAFEIGPFVDGELDDAELDAAFDFEARHGIPPVRTASGLARDVLLAPRTVREARRLLEATTALALDRSIVAALGIRALGPERRAKELVVALEGAGERAWSEVLGLVEDAQFSPRMFSEALCEACGARNVLPVPADRALDRLAPPGAEPDAAATRPDFPDLDAFERAAREHVERVFARHGLRNIDVVVDDGIPFVDAGGEPLLGCYTPGDPLAEPPAQPEIRVFYRTFAAEHRRDPEFSVDEEIEETIDHEARHHLHHLEGDDPMDDEERSEIVRERVRVVGKRELARRQSRAFFEDIGAFLKVAFPLVLLLAILSLVRYCA